MIVLEGTAEAMIEGKTETVEADSVTDFDRVESIDYQGAAEAWGMARWWPLLKRGETYCAVGFEPTGIFLTGPTMKEFHIIDRPDMRGCPPNVNVLVPLAAK